MAANAKNAKVSDGTKYRVAIRDIGQQAGWTFTQVATSTDRFTQGEVTWDATYTAGDRLREVEKVVKGAAPVRMDWKRGKLFRLQEALTGIADEYDPKTGKGKRFIRLSADQVKTYESGRGIAKIASITKEAVTG